MSKKIDDGGLLYDDKLLMFVIDSYVDASVDINRATLKEYADFVKLNIDWDQKRISAQSSNKNFKTRLMFIVTSALFLLEKSKNKPKKVTA